MIIRKFNYNNKKRRGFTLIEILVVISVIAFITVSAIFFFNKARQNAKIKKCVADIKIVAQAIDVKRDEKNDYLINITGSGCSDCACRIGGGNYNYSKQSINTPSCISNMTSVFKKIGFSYLPKDPWGDPYLIDENEKEWSGDPCREDILQSYNCGMELIDFYACK
jgi:prepilin-type N-terminal cleavage/methylation domain-containing protein